MTEECGSAQASRIDLDSEPAPSFGGQAVALQSVRRASPVARRGLMDPRQRTQLQDTCEVPGFPNRARSDEAWFRNEGTSRRRENLDSNNPRQGSPPASRPSRRTWRRRINVPGIRHSSRCESTGGKCVPHCGFLAGRKCRGATRYELIAESSSSIQQRRFSWLLRRFL